jgi:NADH:ubiquinone oxidoreductase subunit E
MMSTTAEVEALLQENPLRADELIAILQRIQARFHYLPEEALRAVARRLRIPLTQVFHVATFYNCFSLEPRGRHHLRVCLGTACHVRGGQRILEKVLRELNLPASGTTADFDFTVEPVRCLGCCGLAPVVRVDQTTFGHLMQSRVPKLLKRYRAPKVEAA